MSKHSFVIDSFVFYKQNYHKMEQQSSFVEIL